MGTGLIAHLGAHFARTGVQTGLVRIDRFKQFHLNERLHELLHLSLLLLLAAQHLLLFQLFLQQDLGDLVGGPRLTGDRRRLVLLEGCRDDARPGTGRCGCRLVLFFNEKLDRIL
jgi:hypothetical protein